MGNSTLKCTGCKQRYPRALETWIKTPAGNFHDDKCAAQTAIQRARVHEKKQARRRRQDYWASDLSHQIELTQKVFNRMIRLLDSHLPCITCGKPPSQCQITAGHCLSVGSNTSIRFIPLNCHGQCSGCNSGQQRKHRGDRAVTSQKFKDSVAVRYGQEALEWLLGPHPMADYTCDELQRVRKVLSKECRHLEAGNQPTRDWRAIRDWREILDDKHTDNSGGIRGTVPDRGFSDVF